MSLKETLGLRSHREDPKMFWFEMTLLCLILGLVGSFLSLAELPGISGLIFRVLGGLGLNWALLCAVLTEATAYRKKSSISRQQIQFENQILLFTAVLTLLDRLLRLFPAADPSFPVVLAGIALYSTARIAGPRIHRKERFTTREILLILACGVLAFIFLVPFLDLALEVCSAL